MLLTNYKLPSKVYIHLSKKAYFNTAIADDHPNIFALMEIWNKAIILRALMEGETLPNSSITLFMLICNNYGLHCWESSSWVMHRLVKDRSSRVWLGYESILDKSYWCNPTKSDADSWVKFANEYYYSSSKNKAGSEEISYSFLAVSNWTRAELSSDEHVLALTFLHTNSHRQFLAKSTFSSSSSLAWVLMSLTAITQRPCLSWRC